MIIDGAADPSLEPAGDAEPLFVPGGASGSNDHSHRLDGEISAAPRLPPRIWSCTLPPWEADWRVFRRHDGHLDSGGISINAGSVTAATTLSPTITYNSGSGSIFMSNSRSGGTRLCGDDFRQHHFGQQSHQFD